MMIAIGVAQIATNFPRVDDHEQTGEILCSQTGCDANKSQISDIETNVSNVLCHYDA